MKTIKLIIPALMILLLCGCDNRKCIKSHQETFQTSCVFYTYVYTGKVMIPIPYYYDCTQTKTVCDEYEEIDTNENN